MVSLVSLLFPLLFDWRIYGLCARHIPNQRLFHGPHYRLAVFSGKTLAQLVLPVLHLCF